MFIHFGMSTYLSLKGYVHPDGNDPVAAYAPDKLDVDQWISVARDAGMKYAVLTAKHVAGHCLWPSKYTDYTVANSPNKTNVVEKFVESCRRRGVLPGLYYCSYDNHNRFGSRTCSDFVADKKSKTASAAEKKMPAFTTSLYQAFQTSQIDELLTQFGPIAEIWIDIPFVLGRGYRTFLYHHIAQLQPETVILTNGGINDGDKYDVASAWPSDLIAIERRLPPATGHNRWRTIEGKKYYMPGEVCDPLGKEWFHVPGDLPRSDAELREQFKTCRERNANFLLNVPPTVHGLIPQEHIDALMRLRKNAGI
jgi:alpha-L-fucosidase